MKDSWHRNSDWTSFTKLLISTIAVGITFWILLFIVRYSTFSPETLAFPSDKSLRVSGEIKFQLDEADASRIKRGLKFQFWGKPTSLQNSTSYELRCDEMQIFDEDDRLVIGFHREEEQTVRYQSDSRFSDAERRLIYQQYHVDLASNSFSADRSLFQQRSRIVLSTAGGIRELQLTSDLRNGLYDLFERSAAAGLFFRFLSHPDGMTPLMSLSRQEVERDGPILKITAKGDESFTTLKWTYNEETKLIQDLLFTINIARKTSDRAVNTELRLLVDATLEFSFEENRLSIEDPGPFRF